MVHSLSNILMIHMIILLVRTFYTPYDVDLKKALSTDNSIYNFLSDRK